MRALETHSIQISLWAAIIYLNSKSTSRASLESDNISERKETKTPIWSKTDKTRLEVAGSLRVVKEYQRLRLYSSIVGSLPKKHEVLGSILVAHRHVHVYAGFSNFTFHVPGHLSGRVHLHVESYPKYVREHMRTNRYIGFWTNVWCMIFVSEDLGR